MHTPTNTSHISLLLSAGEPSADQYGAQLLPYLRQEFPEAEISGMGGQALRRAGMHLHVDIDKTGSLMGLIDVLLTLPTLIRSQRALISVLEEQRPALLVAIDYPDFNLRLARHAHARKIPVLYFIPPKIWAWRSSRINIIKRYIDHVAVIFPHEHRFYLERGYQNITFVGHPFAYDPTYAAVSKEQKDALRTELGLEPNRPLIALLPGSRSSEIKRHLALTLQTFTLLKRKIPGLLGAIPIASPALAQMITKHCAEFSADIKCINGDALRLMKCADIGFLKSGTSNLQAALLGLPFIIFFVAPTVSAMVVRRLLTIKQISIVNNVRADTAPEFIQERAKAEAMAEALYGMFADASARAAAQTRFSELRQLLRRDDGSEDSPLKMVAECARSVMRVAE